MEYELSRVGSHPRRKGEAKRRPGVKARGRRQEQGRGRSRGPARGKKKGSPAVDELHSPYIGFL